MKYNANELKTICFEKNLSYQIYEIISNILDRVEDPNNDEDILGALDDELIYYDDQWLIIKEYCSPQEANWEYAIEQFICDLFSIASTILWR